MSHDTAAHQEPDRIGNARRPSGRARTTRLIRQLLAIGLLGAVPATSAAAATSYNGSDYSYDYNTKQNLRTCDQESDSTPVKGRADDDGNLTTDQTILDSDGVSAEVRRRRTPPTPSRGRLAVVLRPIPPTIRSVPWR